MIFSRYVKKFKNYVYVKMKWPNLYCFFYLLPLDDKLTVKNGLMYNFSSHIYYVFSLKGA